MNYISFVLLILYGLPLLFKKYRNKVSYAELILGIALAAYVSWLFNNGEPIFTILILLVAGVLIIPCISRLLFRRNKLTILWLLTALCICFATWYVLKSSADDILNLIDKGKGSLTYIEDGKKEINIDGTHPQPLASVVKVVVAVEYAEQVASQKINPNEKVPYKDIEKYYLPDTDGGAQPAFENEYDTDRLTLNDVAKGMMKFSSNANTDYLLDRLGLDNVNKRLKTLNLRDHSKVYSLVGGMILASKTDEKDFSKDIDEEILVSKAEKYKNEFIKGQIKSQGITQHFNLEHQEYWSEHLTHGSTMDNARVMNDINSNKFGRKQTSVLRTLFEHLADEALEEKYRHYGYKGGSTARVLNGTYYVTEKKSGKKKALVFFLNNLNVWESYKAQKAMNKFRDSIFEDEQYRKKLIK